MEDAIKNIVSYYNFNPINEEADIILVYNAFTNGILAETDKSIVLYYYGIYQMIHNKPDAVNYFILAKKAGDKKAIHFIYKYYENDPEKLKIYLDNNDIDTEILRFFYYEKHEQKKYCIKMSNKFLELIPELKLLFLFYKSKNDIRKTIFIAWFIADGCEKSGVYDQAIIFYALLAPYNTANFNLKMGVLNIKAKKYNEAIPYLMQSSDIKSYVYIANCYLQLGNITEAKRWLLNAIEKGNIMSNYTLAEILRRNENDMNAAIPYYEKAAENNMKDAFIILSHYYNQHEPGSEKARKYTILAADYGHDGSYYNAGVHCINICDYAKTHHYFMNVIKSNKETTATLNSMDHYYLYKEPIAKNALDYFMLTKKYNNPPRTKLFSNRLNYYITEINLMMHKCDTVEF